MSEEAPIPTYCPNCGSHDISIDGRVGYCPSCKWLFWHERFWFDGYSLALGSHTVSSWRAVSLPSNDLPNVAREYRALMAVLEAVEKSPFVAFAALDSSSMTAIAEARRVIEGEIK